MLFNSIEFLIFFPVVVLIYFLLPFKLRIIGLLIASYYFYMSWKPEYIILIVLSTLIDFFVARRISATAKKTQQKFFLLVSLAANIGLLFIFKYFNFFSDSIFSFFNLFQLNITPPQVDVILPVGISFYTFQTLSYTIDVYRGFQKPETNIGKFALYVAFFPQLVAGPIERSLRLLPQFDRKVTIDYKRITDGLKLMTWGFFKKLVIADRLAAVVNSVYNNPGDFSGVPILIATYFFAIQIYCDFSGYSDIAIGAAKVLGYDLMENFKQPYFAKSINEFWHRWHISLSTWFRDYVYIPLGGNRVFVWRWYFNIFIVFLISGLWHGANWTFVIWGALHGVYSILTFVLSKLSNKRIKFSLFSNHGKWVNLVKIFITFHLVLFSWIFFRANSISDAFQLIKTMFTKFQFSTAYGLNLGGIYEIGIIGVSLIILFLVDYFRERGIKLELISRGNLAVRWSLYYALVFSILIFGKFGISEFIYFQF